MGTSSHGISSKLWGQVVESRNSRITDLGKDKVHILTKIKESPSLGKKQKDDGFRCFLAEHQCGKQQETMGFTFFMFSTGPIFVFLIDLNNKTGQPRFKCPVRP